MITSGCGSMPSDYGVPPAVIVSGDVFSSEGKVQGIQMRLISPVSSDVLDLSLSDQYGYFWLTADILLFAPPDSVILEAWDVDGGLNGSYLPVDTLLFFDEDPFGNPQILINADIELTPDED